MQRQSERDLRNEVASGRQGKDEKIREVELDYLAARFWENQDFS